jgi:peptidoglycan/xylan/chitin deacetylase (PgdA/CDA1 family)
MLSTRQLRLLLLITLTASLWAQRQVAITIDDLPRGGDAHLSPSADRAMTIKLLTPFKTEQIPLTGFVNECHHTDEAADLLQLWAASGADLGNHTCSHLDLNDTPVSAFEADVLKGESITTTALGRPPRYFRYPYLHLGKTPDVKEKVEAFIQQRGYLMAPVTIDTADYMFARVYADKLAAGVTAESTRVLASYIQYMDSIFAFFETWGRHVTGHDIKQILLIHASQLNADAMPKLLRMIRGRGYELISLTEALSDDAYQLEDGYVGSDGISWIHRWAMGKGLTVQREPNPPAWIMSAFKQASGN